MSDIINVGDIIIIENYLGNIPYKLVRISADKVKFINLLTGNLLDYKTFSVDTKLTLDRIIRFYENTSGYIKIIKVIPLKDQVGLKDYAKWIIGETGNKKYFDVIDNYM